MTGRTTTAAIAMLLALTGCAEPEASSTDPEPTTAEDSASATVGPDDSPAANPSPSATQETAAQVTVPVYYIADTERAGPRLYREFRRATGDRFSAALELLMDEPLDPDYRTLWRPGQLHEAHFDGIGDDGVLQVSIDPSVRTRPADMTQADARAAVQQVVYTLHAVVQARPRVQFYTDDERVERIFGVAVPPSLRNASPLSVLSHASITSPEQGQTFTGDTLELSGVGNSFEANLGWEIRQGDRVVDRGYATMAGWMEDKLFPFTTTVDISRLDPGDYSVWVTTDDPTGGTEGIGAMTDDKQFTVE